VKEHQGTGEGDRLVEPHPVLPEAKAAGGGSTSSRGPPTRLPPSRKRGSKRRGGMETGPCSGRQANAFLASLTSPPQLPFSNRYGALECEGPATEEVGEGPCRGLPRMSQAASCIMAAHVKKKRRVIVLGTEGPICQPDASHREVCCLPGARVRDVARKLPSLVQPSDYYPLLFMHIGSDEITERSPKAIKRDFRGLGRLVQGSGAQVVFSSIPSVARKSAERDRKTHTINMWLRDWCHRWNFGVFLIMGRFTQHRACWRQM